MNLIVITMVLGEAILLVVLLGLRIVMRLRVPQTASATSRNDLSASGGNGILERQMLAHYGHSCERLCNGCSMSQHCPA